MTPGTDPEDGPPGLAVLLADDEPMIRRAIRRLLERRGHRVLEAPDAAEALEVVASEALDAALVDVNMPGGGISVLHALHENPDFRGVAVVMTGALTSELEGVPPGVHRVQKPFDFDALVRLVEGGEAPGEG